MLYCYCDILQLYYIILYCTILYRTVLQGSGVGWPWRASSARRPKAPAPGHCWRSRDAARETCARRARRHVRWHVRVASRRVASRQVRSGLARPGQVRSGQARPGYAMARCATLGRLSFSRGEFPHGRREAPKTLDLWALLRKLLPL